MLESMRKHAQGWMAKVILGTIILSFALWGIGDYFTGNHLETVAEIDGEAIYDGEFVETYNRQLNSYRNMLGEQFDKEMANKLGVKDETIQTMINRRLMLMEANNLGLVVPDQAVLGTVQRDPAFQEAKSFSSVRYQNLIRQMGFASPRDYENYLRQSILIDSLQTAVMNSATVSEDEVMDKFKSKYEKRVISAIIVNPKNLLSSVKVSDEQARTWYESHASRYQSPLKVEVNVVEINAADLTDNIVVTDADIEAAYADMQSEEGAAEKSLSEVHDALAEKLRSKMASDEAFRLSQDLDNALGMEDSLESAAKSVNLKVQHLGKLTTDNALANPLLGSSKELQKIAFTMMPGDAVELTEVEEGHFVALEVTQRMMPETMPYEDVVKLVYSDVREDEAKKKAQQLADEILAAAKAGKGIDELAQKFAQPKYISKSVLPDGVGDDAPWLQTVLSSAFRTPAKSWVDSTLYTAQGVAAVYVNTVEKADESKFDAEKDKVREEALKSKGSVRFTRWLSAVRDRHQVSVNDKVLSRF